MAMHEPSHEARDRLAEPPCGHAQRSGTRPWVASQAVLDDLIASLRKDMTARSDTYLDVLDVMAARYPVVLRHVVRLSERFLAGTLPSLDELGEDERLTVTLCEIDAPMSRSVRFSHLVSGRVGHTADCVASWLLLHRKAVRTIKAFEALGQSAIATASAVT